MQVKDIMTTDVESISPDTSIRVAAQKMKNFNAGPIPLVENHAVVGIVTDRDIAVRAVAEGKDPNTTAVKEIASRDVVYCFEDQDVEDVAKLMAAKQIRRILVLNHDDRLVGIVSLGDVATDTRDKKMSGEALEKISQPGR